MKLEKGRKVYVAGHGGMVGSALVRRLESGGYGVPLVATSRDVDLREQAAVRAFFEREKPEVVVVAAARVGGIHANATYPAEFIYDNLMVAANVVDAAYRSGVGRLLFLGSSCIYPKEAGQPMEEECLLTGPLEPTNEAYAVAKIAGLKLCQHYRAQYGAAFHSAMPTNLYGTGDNYHPDNSHVIPALLRRFHEAKESGASEVVMWGTGTPRREFLYVDDLADACVHLLEQPVDGIPDWVNVGSGTDISIRELGELVAGVVGFEGRIVQDLEKPDGTPRKLMDGSKIRALGWRPRTALREGLELAYGGFLSEAEKGTLRSA